MSQMSSMKDLKSKLISDKHAVGDLSKEEGKVRLQAEIMFPGNQQSSGQMSIEEVRREVGS
jgi:hypothetical protein